MAIPLCEFLNPKPFISLAMIHDHLRTICRQGRQSLPSTDEIKRGKDHTHTHTQTVYSVYEVRLFVREDARMFAREPFRS